THTFAAACRQKGVGFSFGFPVDFRIKDIVDAIPATAWYPAIEYDDMREGAWVTEASEHADLAAWPEGSRLILRKERPHPGAQLTFTDVEGMRITAFLTDTPLESSRVRSPGWSYVTVSTLGWRTVSGRPRPLACVTCHVEPGTRTWPGCRSCSWPPIWSPGPNSSPSPTLPPWPSARSPRSATASCTSLPTPPEAPDKYAYALTGPGAGPQRSPPAGAEYAPPSADRPTLSQRPGEPRNPAHPATTAGPSSCPDPAPGPETDPTLADRRRPTAPCPAPAPPRPPAQARPETRSGDRSAARDDHRPHGPHRPGHRARRPPHSRALDRRFRADGRVRTSRRGRAGPHRRHRDR